MKHLENTRKLYALMQRQIDRRIISSSDIYDMVVALRPSDRTIGPRDDMTTDEQLLALGGELNYAAELQGFNPRDLFYLNWLRAFAIYHPDSVEELLKKRERPHLVLLEQPNRDVA